MFSYNEDKNQDIALQNQQPLTRAQNPTDWKALTQSALSP
jgi:hypothetical protein